MNWPQFTDHVSHTYLAGAVVASWSLTQVVAGSSPFTVMTNIFVSEFSETFKKNCYQMIATIRSDESLPKVAKDRLYTTCLLF